jgi:hypothetical protein
MVMCAEVTSSISAISDWVSRSLVPCSLRGVCRNRLKRNASKASPMLRPCAEQRHTGNRTPRTSHALKRYPPPLTGDAQDLPQRRARGQSLGISRHHPHGQAHGPLGGPTGGPLGGHPPGLRRGFTGLFRGFTGFPFESVGAMSSDDGEFSSSTSFGPSSGAPSSLMVSSERNIRKVVNRHRRLRRDYDAVIGDDECELNVSCRKSAPAFTYHL